MRCLLTSAGVTNASIRDALVDLLGKPIAESSALIIPTAIYPFPGGGRGAWRAIRPDGPLAGLGWKSLGLLELSVLPSIEDDAWIPMVRETDALLFWGGDPVFLAHWMRQSRLADLLPSLQQTVYVGVSAGAIAASATFTETYRERPKGKSAEVLASEDIVFATPQGDIHRILVTARGVGLVDFAMIPHFEHADHEDASLANAERWAAKTPVPTYAIDDQSALKVTDGAVEVISEGRWKLFRK